MPMDGGVIPVEEALAAKGRAVLTSTTSMDDAFERLNGDLSVYGHYLVEGLKTGAAAATGSNHITIADLHAYVSRKVQEEAPAMVPQWFASGQAAQFPIAKVAIDLLKKIFCAIVRGYLFLKFLSSIPAALSAVALVDGSS